MRVIFNIFKSIFVNAYNFLLLMFSGTIKVIMIIISGRAKIDKIEDQNNSSENSVFLDIESDKFKSNFVKNINILKDINRKNC